MKSYQFLMAFACILLFQNVAHAQIPSYVPTNGLVGWWPFNGNANDESGNGNHRSIIGPVLSPDRDLIPNQAFSFDGSNDYMEGACNGALNVQNLTFACWIQMNTTTGTFGVGGSYANPSGYFIRIVSGEPTFRIHNGSFPNPSPLQINAASTISSGSWNLIVFTKDALEMRAYINGVHTSTLPLNGFSFSNQSRLRIGCNSWDYSEYFPGKIDDIGIWNRALSPCEIFELYTESAITHPAISLSGTSTFCMGDSVILSAPSGVSYLWSDSSTNQTFSASQNGAYYVDVTDSSGCTLRSDTIEVVVLPTASTNQTYSLCQGQSVTVGGNIYSQPGTYVDTLSTYLGCDSIIITGLTILQPTTATLTESACDSYILNGQTYTQSGNYTQTLVNAAGCDSVITLNLTIANLSASVSFAGGTLTASPSGATYQWVNCELGYQPIVGSTGQSYTPDSTGNYAVVVTSGPCTDTSACTSVVVVGTENGLQQVITLYPNPTDGLLNVAGLPEGSKYLLMDAQGRKVMKGSGSGTLSLDLGHLPAGVYLLGVEAQGTRQQLRVVVEK